MNQVVVFIRPANDASFATAANIILFMIVLIGPGRWQNPVLSLKSLGHIAHDFSMSAGCKVRWELWRKLPCPTFSVANFCMNMAICVIEQLCASLLCDWRPRTSLNFKIQNYDCTGMESVTVRTWRRHCADSFLTAHFYRLHRKVHGIAIGLVRLSTFKSSVFGFVLAAKRFWTLFYIIVTLMTILLLRSWSSFNSMQGAFPMFQWFPKSRLILWAIAPGFM